MRAPALDPRSGLLTPAQEWHLDCAVRCLRGGGVVLHATEGVWGLAGDAFAPGSVARILEMKRRHPNKGLIVIAATAEEFAPELASLPARLRHEILASWPGPVTWVLPSKRFPDFVTGGRSQVALRVPGHEQARALCAGFGGLLVSTSANRSGRPPARTALQAQAQFPGRAGPDYVLPGATGASGAPSEIRSAGGRILRAGAQ